MKEIQTESETQVINRPDYWGKTVIYLKKYLKFIILALIAGAMVGYCIAHYLITPSYLSYLDLYVNVNNSSIQKQDDSVNTGDIDASQKLVNSYIVTLKANIVTNRILEKLNGLSNDLEKAYDSGDRPVPEDAKRILITGCPIGGVLEKTVKAIEANGGVVVCYENCSGVKAVAEDVDLEADDIVRAIAKRYLSIGCAVMTPDNRRMELIRKLIGEYKVDGVVEVVLQTCTPYAVEAFSVRKYMEELGMPYLGVETDYSSGDTGQLGTRIEAFLEML